MVFFTKSQPASTCLALEKAKAAGDYKCGDVLERLKNDFKNKCYICEQKAPTTINVEHFVAHQGDIELKFDWNNLFWVCGHCNNIKLAKFNLLLNCTLASDAIETKLKYNAIFFPFDDVVITALDNDDKTLSTRELLLLVYNGSTTLKSIEAENIKSALTDEIIHFQAVLRDYFKYRQEERLKDKFLVEIEKHLSRSSAFTAFKHGIIKDRPIFLKEFGGLLND
jgi:hypothetical protein